MAVKVSRMDPEFEQYFRVTGAADDAEALAAAAAVWPAMYGDDPHYALDDDTIPEMAVESKGWYRCQPCVCGLEHRYDVWPTDPHARGASFTWLIGLATEKVPA